MSATDERGFNTGGTEPESEAAVYSDTQIPDASANNDAASDAAKTPAESFDYVVPAQRSKKRRKSKGKHHRSHSDASGAADKNRTHTDTDDYVFPSPSEGHHSHKHGSKKRMARWKKVLLIILSVILALIIALGATYLIMREIGRSHMHNLDDAQIVTPTEDDSIVAMDPNGQIINYKGKSYELNKDIFSVTVIGADDSTDVNGEDARMGDAIYILAVDTKTGKIKVLGVSRDTMADVDVYSVEGKYIDTEKKQISFAYSYTGEKVTGGKNTTVSLTRLFFGLPLENYFAINLDALQTLNDSIGGVTLTSKITFVSPEDGRTISEGETVTLHGKEAEYYIRHRDKEVLDSNNERMERQQQYIRAFISSIIPAVKEDISRVSSLYNETAENSDSNMSLSDIVYMTSVILPKINAVNDIEYVSLKGEMTEGEFAELNVSNDDAITAMLEVFYRPLS